MGLEVLMVGITQDEIEGINTAGTYFEEVVGNFPARFVESNEDAYFFNRPAALYERAIGEEAGGLILSANIRHHTLSILAQVMLARGKWFPTLIYDAEKGWSYLRADGQAEKYVL